MSDRETGRQLGERRKQLALDLFEVTRADVVLLARLALLRAVLANGTATIDDVREVVELPPGMNPKLFGAVMRGLAAMGLICKVGTVATSRPKAHARDIGVWECTDRYKVGLWLEKNKPAEPGATGTAGNFNSPTGESEECENAKVSE